MQYANYGNRLHGEFSLSLFTMSVDIDELIRTNLKRLLAERSLQQNRLAEAIEKRPSEINDILAGRKPMGKDTMMRLCRELEIEPWEFYWTEKTPIVRDEREKERLYLYREEERLGVAEDVAKYERFMVEQARLPETSGRENAKPGVARRRKRAG